MSSETRKYDPTKGNEQHLRPETLKRLIELRERQRQKFLRDREITGYESAPENDGLEEVRGG